MGIVTLLERCFPQTVITRVKMVLQKPSSSYFNSEHPKTGRSYCASLHVLTIAVPASKHRRGLIIFSCKAEQLKNRGNGTKRIGMVVKERPANRMKLDDQQGFGGVLSPTAVRETAETELLQIFFEINHLGSMP